MIALATPAARLLLATFRKLPVRDQIRMLRQAKATARKLRPDKKN